MNQFSINRVSTKPSPPGLFSTANYLPSPEKEESKDTGVSLPCLQIQYKCNI